MSHVNLSSIPSLLQEVRHARTVIHVEMSEQKQVYLFWIDHVEVGQCLYAFTSRMESAIKHDLPALALQIKTRSTDLAASAERHDLQIVFDRAGAFIASKAGILLDLACITDIGISILVLSLGTLPKRNLVQLPRHQLIDLALIHFKIDSYAAKNQIINYFKIINRPLI